MTLAESADQDAADRGLHLTSVACDLEVPGGEWVVDAEDLDALREGYGDDLVVLWEQAG